MSRLFYHVMQDNAGNLLFDVSGTMRLAGTGTLATIYGDAALTIPIPNPMTNHPSFGSFKCYLDSGAYDFVMAKAGYTFETLTGLQGWGSMALQDADAVAITGGNVSGLAILRTVNAPSDAFVWGLQVGSGLPLTHQGHFRVAGAAEFEGVTGIASVTITHNKTTQNGITMKAASSDTGNPAQVFLNVAGTQVGSISTTAAATAYNTTSDSRLKTAVEELTGELALIRALRPVRFRWLVDDSPGVGFLASEVAEHVQGVVTGEPGAVDEEGRILPQQIDYSKLVPFLVGACQTLARRLAVLEDALGVS